MTPTPTPTGHVVDGTNSNTYRAIRCAGPAAAANGHGTILYAELTAGIDWHFQHVSLHEMYALDMDLDKDLDKDPYQLNKTYHAASPQLLANLSAALDAQYVCSTCKQVSERRPAAVCPTHVRYLAIYTPNTRSRASSV